MRKMFLFLIIPFLLFSCSNGGDSEVAEPVPAIHVCFDGNGSDGGSAPDKTSIQPGQNVVLPDCTFTRTDHNFTGWNTKNDGTGILYHPGNILALNASITLYAQWEETVTVQEPVPEEKPDCTYKVKHYMMTDYGTFLDEPDDTEILNGKAGDRTEARDRTIKGFTAAPFAQSTIASDNSTEISIFYSRIYVTINFDKRGGAGGCESTSGLYGSYIHIRYSDVRKEGYDFVGWSEPISDYYEKDMNVYAIWKPKQYTITFDYEMSMSSLLGDHPSSKSVTYMEEYGTLPRPSTGNGIRFEYWSSDRSGISEIRSDDIYDIAGDTTLYAIWENNDD